MAAETGRAIHGRAPRRGRFPGRAGRSRAVEPVSFRAVVQTIVRGTAAPLLAGPADRTGKGVAGQSTRLDYPDRVRCGIQRHERIQLDVSSSLRGDAVDLSPEPCLRKSGCGDIG